MRFWLLSKLYISLCSSVIRLLHAFLFFNASGLPIPFNSPSRSILLISSLIRFTIFLSSFCQSVYCCHAVGVNNTFITRILLTHLKQKKAEQEEHLQWLEKKLQAEQEKQERLDTFELNSKRVVVNGSSTQICLERYKTAIVFGTVNTVSQSLILISRNYKDQIDIKSLCGASETSITGNVNLETGNVTLNFSGNNSAIIIW